MKIKDGYRIRKVGSKSVVVAPGGINFTGLITVNETGTFIWNMLSDGAETEEIVSALAKECDVQPDAIRGEVLEFLDALKGADVLE
ncbi:MAG: PqqD family protein [Acutalibacteraceae bacterium]|nr:PqqD family protein [Acutalibacteraceae bacterium]